MRVVVLDAAAFVKARARERECDARRAHLSHHRHEHPRSRHTHKHACAYVRRHIRSYYLHAHITKLKGRHLDPITGGGRCCSLSSQREREREREKRKHFHLRQKPGLSFTCFLIPSISSNLRRRCVHPPSIPPVRCTSRASPTPLSLTHRSPAPQPECRSICVSGSPSTTHTSSSL